MIIKLTPEQIATFWETIKFSIIKSENVPEERQMVYTNRALENLLSGKFQCWIIYTLMENGAKEMHAVGITSVVVDELLGYSFLDMSSMYGFRPLTDELAKTSIEGLEEFARAVGCTKIRCLSSNKRIEYFAEITGFTKGCSVYTKPL